MKKLIIYYFFFLLSTFSFFSSGVIDSTDGFQYLAVARNIYYAGEPTAPVYKYDTRENIHMSTILAKNGKTYSLTGLGFSIAYLPAVAITDFVYKIYGISPPLHFPLENDWLIFLTASFTNSIFGAMLGIILFVYFCILGLTKKQALTLSFLSIIATNLFVYTKHSMPHMMFISFMMLSFLLLKLFSEKGKKYLLIFSGISFGVLSITYNQTFVLPLIPLVLYYFLLIKPKISLNSLRTIAGDAIYAACGFIPFAIIYIWFESLRSYSNSVVFLYTSYVNHHISAFPISVIIEGLHGQLFSAGRSIFIYSPLLIIIILFWHKIKRALNPEFFSFILLTIIYICFFALQYSRGGPDQGIAGLWHGETSWGPRYLTPLIPMGMLLVGSIYQSLSKKTKLFVFYPLVILGIYVNFLGVLMPYQIKLHDLQEKFFLNGTEYKASVYSNFLPRYSPILNMSKKLIKLGQNFPKTFDHGIYNVRFYDGIDLPFNVGPERWRVIEGTGYISFDNNKENPIKDLTFGVINHPISEANKSAKVRFILNDVPLLEKPFKLDITQRELIKVSVKENLVMPKGNKLVIEVDFGNPIIITMAKQILGLQSFDINDTRQNMESIDVPYISVLGPKMTGDIYQNWGGENQDLWKIWDIHTQTYERLPDFWWIRNLYYWDIPKRPILLLFSGIILISTYTGFRILRLLTKKV